MGDTAGTCREESRQNSHRSYRKVKLAMMGLDVSVEPKEADPAPGLKDDWNLCPGRCTFCVQPPSLSVLNLRTLGGVPRGGHFCLRME